MPLINLEYDSEKVSVQEAEQLSKAIQQIVSDVTGIEDVFVYGNSAEIKIQIAPVEIFVEMSAHKIENLEKLTGQIKEKLSAWKVEVGFKHPINLTVIPMNWKVEVGI